MKINIEKRHLYILIGLIILVSVGYVIAQTPGVSHHPDEISPQGAGSGLDADTVDGLHANQIGGGGGGSMSCYEYTVRQGGSTLAAIPANVVQECTYNCYFTLSAWLEEGSGGGPHHWVINSGTISTNEDPYPGGLWTSVNIGADTYANWHDTEMADGENMNGVSEIIAALSVCNFRDGESATADTGQGWSLSWTSGTSGEYCVLTLCPT